MNTDYLEKLRKINFDRFLLLEARYIWREKGEKALGEYINAPQTTTFKDYNQLDGYLSSDKAKALIKSFEAEDNVKRIGDISGKGYGFDPIVNHPPLYSKSFFNEEDWLVHAGIPRYTHSQLTRLLQQTELESESTNYIKTTGTMTTKVKSKKAFYTFDLQGRKVTIAAVTRGGTDVSIGYAVCMVEDIKFNEDGTFDDKISKLTATGRAVKKPLGKSQMDLELVRSHGMLKSVAMLWASKIQKGEIVIKGIKALTKSEKKIIKARNK